MKTPLRYLFAAISGFSALCASPQLTHLVLRTCDGEHHNIELTGDLAVKLNDNTLEIASVTMPATFAIEEVASLSYATLPMDGTAQIPGRAPAIKFSHDGISISAEGVHTLLVYDASARLILSGTFSDHIDLSARELPAGVLIFNLDGATIIKLAAK